jgi:hypothetical protein
MGLFVQSTPVDHPFKGARSPEIERTVGLQIVGLLAGQYPATGALTSSGVTP